jgi:hypothetical protein
LTERWRSDWHANSNQTIIQGQNAWLVVKKGTSSSAF